MLKRIIFCLYFKDGYFYLSRNFKLQKVGNLEWLIENFKFHNTSTYVDELVIILLKKNPNLACVVGLTSDPERLVDIRKNRMITLQETESTNYTNLEKISKEVEEAKKTFKKYKWPTIDITRKSVEETAASIIKIYEITKENG